MKKLAFLVSALVSLSAFAGKPAAQNLDLQCGANAKQETVKLRVQRGSSIVDVLTVNGIKTSGGIANLTEEMMAVITASGNYDVCMKDDGQDGFTITRAIPVK